jgi:hypothetical protein
VGYYDHPAAAARVQPDQEFDADRVALIASWRRTLVGDPDRAVRRNRSRLTA